MHSKLKLILAASALSVGASGLVMAATDPGASAAAGVSAPASIKLTAGEVRKVDADQGKLTIKHEPIENLDMPAMTMVFKAGKAELLKDLKAGDKIRFRAETVAGAIVVTDIKAVK